jgi:hypothetical protein
MAGPVRCAQCHYPAGLLLRKIKEEMANHQSAQAMTDEVNDWGLNLPHQFLQHQGIMSWIAAYTLIPEMSYPVAMAP